MRIAKRALAGLLILTVLVCALYVASFADSVPVVDCEELLTYFDPLTSKAYVMDDFEDGAYDGRLSNTAADTDATRIEIASGDEGSYLSLITGPIFNRFASGELAYVADTTDVPEGRYALYIKCSVNASYTARAIGECSARCGYYAEDTVISAIPDACPNCASDVVKDVSRAPAASVYVSSDAAALGQRLITLDFASDTVTYYGGSADITVAYDLAENTDTWYDIEIVLLENNEYRFNVSSSAGAATVSASEIAAPTVGTTAGVAFGYAHTSSNRDTVINLDNVLVQCGDKLRALTPAELETKVGAVLKDFIAILERSTDTAVKLEVVDTYNKIVDTYGFTSDDPEIVADMATVDNKVLDILFDSLLGAVSAIDSTADYQLRLDHVEFYRSVVEKVEELVDELGITDSAYADAIAAYHVECDALALDAENTERFMAYMQQLKDEDPTLFYTNDYESLKSFTELVASDYPYNPTYPGVDEARDNHLSVSGKYTLYCSQAIAFVGAVDTAASTDPTVTLTAKLEAYEYATENFFRHDTFPGVADAIEALESLSDFAGIKAQAMDFISKLKIAEHLLYIDSQEAALEEAEAVMDLANDDYVGVKEAKERCVELRKEITAKRAAAAEYIAAVEAIKGLEGKALADAVANALEKQKTGNIPGIPGVTDANIALDNAHMALENVRVYSEKYITLVNAIDGASDLGYRYSAIRAAKAAEADASDTVSGVAAARTKLAQAITAYNADMNSVNSAYASVASQAGSLSGATMSVTGVVALVIALIKAII